MKYNLYFHCSENTAFYIFTAVKYSFFNLINIFLYFITLYIIKRRIDADGTSKPRRIEVDATSKQRRIEVDETS